MERLVASVMLLVILPNAALAEVPRYDVEAYCTEIAGFGDEYSSVMYNGCFSMEQSAYDGSKAQWTDLPLRIQSYRDGIARFGSPGSYVMLESCVQMEVGASDQSNTFKY